CQQHSLERDASGVRELLEAVREVWRERHRQGLDERSARRGGAWPARQTGGVATSEGGRPILLTALGGERAAFEGDEVAEAAAGCDGQRALQLAEQHEIVFEQFSEHRRDAPAIQNGVMLTERKLERLLTAQVQMDARQRRMRERKATLLFSRDKGS